MKLLLADAIENDVATLRFYQWSEPTLSLGYFQRYDERDATRRQPRLRRRPSPIRAAARSCTIGSSHTACRYPAVTRWRGKRGELYNSVHQAFIAVLTAARGPDMPPATLRMRGEPTRALAGHGAVSLLPTSVAGRRHPGR